MGLMTCSKCKKLFNYDKYYGVCPNCGRYNRLTSAADEHQELHDTYDGGYSHTENDDHYRYHDMYDNDKTVCRTVDDADTSVDKPEFGSVNTKKSKGLPTLIIICIVLSFLFGSGFIGILFFIVTMIVVAKSKKGNQNK